MLFSTYLSLHFRTEKEREEKKRLKGRRKYTQDEDWKSKMCDDRYFTIFPVHQHKKKKEKERKISAILTLCSRTQKNDDDKISKSNRIR